MKGLGLELRSITRTREGGFQLKVPSLRVTPGEVVGVVGGNGVGKTTLLLVLGLLLEPDTGEVCFDGQPAHCHGRKARAQRRLLGVAFRDPGLFRGSVLDNVSLPLRLRGANRTLAQTDALAALDLVDAASLADQRARALSSGQAQRVALARALVGSPRALLLDEPLSALDPASRGPLLRRVVALARDRGLTVVMVTHQRDEAAPLPDNLVLMDSGGLAESGPPDQVIDHPHSYHGARWAGFENRLAGRLRQPTSRNALPRVTLKGGLDLEVVPPGTLTADCAVTACIRAEAVSVWAADAANPASSVRNQIRGTVVTTQRHGNSIRLVVGCGDGQQVQLEAVISVLSAERLQLTVGAVLQVGIKATAIHLIEA